MKQYRILEHTNNVTKSSYYTIQRKFFGIWFTLDNFDAYTTGTYQFLDEAKNTLKMKLSKINTKVVCQTTE